MFHNFTQKQFVSTNRKSGYLYYLEYLPKNIKSKIPLVVYLHGAGSRGDSLDNMGIAGPVKEIEDGRKLNAVVVAPQCHCDTWFELYDVLLEYIDKMISDGRVDKKRIYLCGSSMGAYTAWQVAMSRPEWFAALVPVCGGGMYWNAAKIKDLHIWAFHGALDSCVLPEESIHMVAAVNNNGGNAKLTILPKAAHDAWTQAFSDDSLWEWMFIQRRL